MEKELKRDGKEIREETREGNKGVRVLDGKKERAGRWKNREKEIIEGMREGRKRERGGGREKKKEKQERKRRAGGLQRRQEAKGK